MRPGGCIDSPDVVSHSRAVTEFENAGVRWEVQPGFADSLGQVLSSPPEIVKTSPVKSVTRHVVAGRVYFVKRYRHAAVPLRAIKFIFRQTQARQEWNIARELERRGVPAVRHLALGERRSLGGVHESILVTEGFDGGPLEDAPETDPQAVLEFVRQMHAAGVLQRDLHPGNLLVRAQPGAPPEIRLVDLHGTIVKPALTPDEQARNLARLAVSFPLPVSPPVRKLAAALRRQLWFDRSRRCLRHNREFAPRRAGGLRWWTRPSLLTEPARRVLEDPDGFLASRARILKPGRSSTVGLADGVVLKRYNLRKAGNLIKDLFRQSKARRAYRKAYHLELAGVPTARIVATADRRVLGWLWRSYVLMQAIPGAIDLGTHLAGGEAPAPELLQQAGQLVGRLHREGLTHRDLKETNLVLDADGKLHLLDLDGLEFVNVVSPARTRSDLARLARGVSRFRGVRPEHMKIFLRHYARARSGPDRFHVPRGT